MKTKEYVFRYIVEGTAVLDNVSNDANGQKQLKIELACGSIPATRTELIILSERDIPASGGC